MKRFLIVVCLICSYCFVLGQNVVQLEYFIDTDKGFGKNTKVNVAASPDSKFSFIVNLSGISEGYHKLYLRTKDDKGKWSITTRRNIEVSPFDIQNKITAGEYFFDTDPGFGKAKKIIISTKDSAIIQDFAAATSGLKPGYHKLYVRFKDTYNNWSMTLRRNVEIVKTQDTADVVSAEYFFDKDPGYGKATAKTFAAPLPDESFTFKIPYNSIPSNADTLFIRVKDSNGDWSLTKRAKFSVSSSLQSNEIAAIQSAEKATSNLNTFSFSVRPNPVINNTLNINIHNPKGGLLKMSLYNMQGKAIFAQQFSASAGSVNKQINMSGIAAGTYIVHISNGVHAQATTIIKE